MPRALNAADLLALRKPSRSSLLLPVAAVVMLVTLLEPVVAPHDSRVFIYPYGALLNLIAAYFCWRQARLRIGADRLGWLMMTAHLALLGIVLGIATLGVWLITPYTRHSTWLMNAGSSLATISCLFALTAGVPAAKKMKRLLDSAMALVLGTLIFLAMSSTDVTGFSSYHLQMSVSVAAFLMLCAFAAQQTTESPERERFTSIVATYLVARTFMLFMVNIVAQFWVTTPRDLPFDLFFGLAPILFLLALRRSAWRIRIGHRFSQRIVARTALPAAVLIASVILGIGLSTQYRWVSGAAILLSVLCFVLRTQLLYEALFEQQTQLQNQASTLEQWALFDHLTGIGNRRFLEQRAAEILATPDCRAAILLLDTDYFKEINDTLGHAEGDKLLQNIANMLKQEIEDTAEGICARIGGDEFAVLLPKSDAAHAMAIAEGLRMSFVSLPLHEELHPTVSIGVTVANGPTTLTMLIGHADSALYASKENGRDRVELAQYPAS